MSVETMRCVCCSKWHRRRGDNDGWSGRMFGYCVDCAWARCDAFPDQCPNAPASAGSTEEQE